MNLNQISICLMIITICLMVATIWVNMFLSNQQMNLMNKEIDTIKKSTNNHLRGLAQFEINKRKEFLKSLTNEIKVNLGFANELLKDLPNYIKGNEDAIYSELSIDVLNINLANNTITNSQLLDKVMRFKDLIVTLNNHLEFMRSGMGTGRTIAKSKVVENYKEEIANFNLDPKNKQYFDKAIDILPDPIPLTKSRIFNILLNLYGNREWIEELRKEIKQYENNVTDISST